MTTPTKLLTLALVLMAQGAGTVCRGENAVIVTLGDSITKGVRAGVEPQQTFSAIVEKRLQAEGVTVEVVNLGIGGERTDQALKRLDAVAHRHPTVVTIMYGTNDSYVDKGANDSRISREQFGDNLQSIVAALRERGIQPILMTEPRWAATARDGSNANPNLRLAPYMETCRQVARDLRVALVDHFAHWTDAEKAGQDLQAWTTDGCHPNPLGHQEIAALMLPELRAALKADRQDLRVLKTTTAAAPPSKSVYRALHELARAAFNERREKFERLTTAEDCGKWQQERKEFFVRQLGGFPERTPLDAQVVGTLDGDGYRIEKVIFASRPHHHITASLYLPAGKPPYPAVLVACGHSRTAKASDYNQKMCGLLARNGMAAFCYDPIGQGERSQVVGDDGQPVHKGTTTEHFLMGVGSILVGTNTAQYRIWDGMRAIDYLAERPDIDATRIGCTGCSGGGTETSYLMALDERVACAAPACYITTFERLIDTIGPQDAEQNIFGQIAFGMEQPDYLIMRAPRPTLICATTKDFFDISGTWDAFRQVSRFYARLGAAERVALVEAEGQHGIGPVGRVAMVQWMRRWLLGVDQPVKEVDTPLRSEQELQCTPRGKVLLLPNERSVFDLNRELAQNLAPQHGEFQQKSAEEQRRAVREIIGLPLVLLPPGTRLVDPTDVIQRDGYRIEKFAFSQHSGFTVPTLCFVPKGEVKDVCLYVHGLGKQADAGVGGPIEQRVKKGQVVIALDLPGIGETAGDAKDPLLGASWKEFYLAYLMGKSMVGVRAEALLTCLPYVAAYPDLKQPAVHLVGIGEASIPALHAAALQPGAFASVSLRDMPKSWNEVVGDRQPSNQLVNTIHGVLRLYDLPDLIRLCGEGRVTTDDAARTADQ